MIDVVPAFEWRDWVPGGEDEEPPPDPVDETLLVPEPAEPFGSALPVPPWERRQVTSGDETWGPDGVTVSMIAGDAYLRPIPAGDFSVVVLMEHASEVGNFVGPMIVDNGGTGLGATWYHNPQSWLTVLLATYTYAGSGNFTQGANGVDMPAAPQCLRLRKSGTNYYTSYSLDFGATWSAETPVWNGASITPTKIGFGCFLGSATVTFLEFYPGDAPEPPPPPPPPPTEFGWITDAALSSALKSFSVETGRGNANEKVATAQASIVLGAQRAGACPEIGRRFRLTLTDELATELGFDEDEAARFTGEITDALIEPERGTYALTAVGRLGRARRRTVNLSGAPTEDDGNRVRRILVAAAPDADLDVDPGTADLFPPPEPAPAGQLLDLVVDSTLGQVVEQPDGVLEWHDADHRRGATPVLELPASVIDSRIRWAQSVGDVVNEVTVGYGVSNASVLFRDPASIHDVEAYAQSITTALVDEADAHSLGSFVVGRRSAPVWQLPELLVNLASERVDDALLAQLLALRHADRIELTGLPSTSPYPASQEVYVEGVTEAAAYLGGGQYAWTRSIAVSDPRLSGVAVRVMDAPVDLVIADVDPTLTVLDCARIEDPEELRA